MRAPKVAPMVNGRDIRAARKRMGVSQAGLADALGVDVMTVSRWERGVRLPARAVYLAISHLEHVMSLPRRKK
jgi:DNA-binding transcriptional regulator YiaG